jgi:Flp pilus assembly pilin Flp
MITRFIFEEEGQSLVEYALLISLVALIVSAAIVMFRNAIIGVYNNIDNKMTINTAT